jgi:hypothetical protein
MLVTRIHRPAGLTVRRPLPLIVARVSAGFPSPADGYQEGRLDLNEHLIANRSSTFLIRAVGDSMRGAGILDGDLLVVDRSLQPRSGDIVILWWRANSWSNACASNATTWCWRRPTTATPPNASMTRRPSRSGAW